MDLSSIPDPFAARIAVADSGCWEWTGAHQHGYGRIKIAGKWRKAHRALYEALFGPLPAWPAVHVDHLCRNKLCVNPDHLEPVTPSENNRRHYGQRTTCPQGHPYDYITPDGHRQCKRCRAAAVARWLARNPDYRRQWEQARAEREWQDRIQES